jgi:hypothetical protein
MSFGQSNRRALLMVVCRANATPACSIRFAPILSKRAECRSPTEATALGAC